MRPAAPTTLDLPSHPTSRASLLLATSYKFRGVEFRRSVCSRVSDRTRNDPRYVAHRRGSKSFQLVAPSDGAVTGADLVFTAKEAAAAATAIGAMAKELRGAEEEEKEETAAAAAMASVTGHCI
ncbi:Uncharacterized protein DBV15_10491 [Temnothorax longispinosus]|uniref:Uncharacterized protein n=1 Tax=Temnothorax longispinosus TaxID=300112 RepID=A0A4S2KLL4_9HYME|nr:Uncharacterized protein DBV15_10491 [Temnothorax longispinosus]